MPPSFRTTTTLAVESKGSKVGSRFVSNDGTIGNVVVESYIYIIIINNNLYTQRRRQIGLVFVGGKNTFFRYFFVWSRLESRRRLQRMHTERSQCTTTTTNTLLLMHITPNKRRAGIHITIFTKLFLKYYFTEYTTYRIVVIASTKLTDQNNVMNFILRATEQT